MSLQTPTYDGTDEWFPKGALVAKRQGGYCKSRTWSNMLLIMENFI